MWLTLLQYTTSYGKRFQMPAILIGYKFSATDFLQGYVVFVVFFFFIDHNLHQKGLRGWRYGRDSVIKRMNTTSALERAVFAQIPLFTFISLLNNHSVAPNQIK